MSFHRVVRLGTCVLLLFFATQVWAPPVPPPPPEVNISGVWSMAGTGSFGDPGKGGTCSYDGSIEFDQDGAQITGDAVIPLVSGDNTSCPSMNGSVSGTVGGTTANFLVGGPVKGIGVTFCAEVIGDSMSGNLQAPPLLPCFVLKTTKGEQQVFMGEFEGERKPAQAPTLSIPALGVLILVLAGLGSWSSRRT